MTRSAIIFAGVVVLASLSQSLGLIAPIFFDFWVRQNKAEHGKGGGRGEDDNQTHVRSPVIVAWALKVNAGDLIYRLESWLTSGGDFRPLVSTDGVKPGAAPLKCV
jgi:hypothetical protein